MYRFVFIFLIVLVFRPANAQSSFTTLRWVTREGVIGTYVPKSQTLTEHQLPFELTTHNVYWLPDDQHFLYLSDNNRALVMVDTEAGSVSCSLRVQSLTTWNISPHHANTLLIFEAVGSNRTHIFRVNWRTCAQETLAALQGQLYSLALSQDVPLLALSMMQTNQPTIQLLNLAEGTNRTLDLTFPINSNLYWTQDSTHLLIENEQGIHLFSPSTDLAHSVDGIIGHVWPVNDASLLLRSGSLSGVSTQLWAFTDDELGEQLLEIDDEVYDHQPGFSPDFRYYAYTQTHEMDTLRVFDWQANAIIAIDNQSSLRRWSPNSRWLTLYNHDNDLIRLYNIQTRAEQSYTGSIAWFGDDIWSNNGLFITYWQADGDHEQLKIVNVSDESVSQVFTRETLDLPGSVRWSRNDAYLYVNAPEFGVDGIPTGCHTIIEVATTTVHSLGCGDWNVWWGH